LTTVTHLARTSVLCLSFLALLSSDCTRDPAKKEARFLARGRKFLDQKDYARAALEFRSANQANPRDAEPWYQLGIAYLGAKQPDNAYVAFMKATELNPNHAAAQVRASEMMVASRDPEVLEEAVKRLRQVMTSGDDPETLGALAMADLKLKKPEEAIGLLEKALNEFPGNIKPAATLAAIQASRHDFNAAEETLRKAAAQAPQSTEAALALANLYFIEDKKAAAEAELQRALRIDPVNASALMALGSLQMAGNRAAEAEETYRKLASIKAAKAPYIHAAFLLQQGRNEEALRELKKLAEAPGADDDARLRLAGAYVATGNGDEALRYLGRLLAADPKDADALLLRGRIYLNTRQAAEAQKDMEAVLRLRPNSADAHYGLSRVQALLGSEKERERELGEVLRLNPNLLQARTELASIQVKAVRAQTALETMDAAPKAQQSSIVFLITRNWALLALNRLEEARSEIDRGLHVERAPELVLQDGILKLLKADSEGSRADAQEVLRLRPADEGALNLAMQACLADKQSNLALQILKETAARNRASAAVQLHVGQWLERLGKLGEARAAFSAAKALNPRLIAADLALAMLDMEEGNSDRARTGLTGILVSQPNNETAHLLLANIEYSQKNFSAALVQFTAVVEANPNNVAALNNLAYLNAAHDLDGSLRYALRAMELAPNDPTVQDTLGWIYYRKGDYQKAVEFLAPSVSKQPSPVRQFHLAMAYFKARDRDRGQQLLNRALAQDPNLFKTEEGWLP